LGFSLEKKNYNGKETIMMKKVSPEIKENYDGRKILSTLLREEGYYELSPL
jgi:hypothetical protein